MSLGSKKCWWSFSLPECRYSMKIKIDDFPPPSMSIGFDVLVGQCTSRRISLFYEFFWSLEHQSKRTFQKILHLFHIGLSYHHRDIPHNRVIIFSWQNIFMCINAFFCLFIFEFSKKKNLCLGVASHSLGINLEIWKVLYIFTY